MKYNINSARLLNNSPIICEKVMFSGPIALISTGEVVKIPNEELKNYEVVQTVGQDMAIIRLRDSCASYLGEEGRILN